MADGFVHWFGYVNVFALAFHPLEFSAWPMVSRCLQCLIHRPVHTLEVGCDPGFFRVQLGQLCLFGLGLSLFLLPGKQNPRGCGPRGHLESGHRGRGS